MANKDIFLDFVHKKPNKGRVIEEDKAKELEVVMDKAVDKDKEVMVKVNEETIVITVAKRGITLANVLKLQEKEQEVEKEEEKEDP